MEAKAQIEVSNTQDGTAYCIAGAVALFIGWFVGFGLVCGPAAIALGAQAYRKGSKGAGQTVISIGLLLTVKVGLFILNTLIIEEFLSRILPFLK